MSEMRRSRVKTGWLVGLVGLGLVGVGCEQIIGFEDHTVDQAQGSAGPGGAGVGSSTHGSGGVVGAGGAGGGPCLPAHVCGIETLYEEMESSYGDISLGPSRVFWLRDNGFSYRDKDPSSPGKEDRVTAFGVRYIAAESDGALYFSDLNDVFYYDVANDTVAEIMMATKPSGLTVHMGFVYWPSVTGGEVYKGQPGNAVSTTNPTGDAPSSITSSAGIDQVYWTYHGPMPDMATGSVRRLNHAGDLVGVPPQKRPTGIAADGEDVYWITEDGAIHKHAGASQTLVDAIPPAGDMHVLSGRIAVSPAYVYWLGPDTITCTGSCACGEYCGAVLRVPKSNITQPPEVFADMDWPVLKGLAVDATHVYWTTEGAASKLFRKAH
jgi:hypothetical protein